MEKFAPQIEKENVTFDEENQTFSRAMPLSSPPINITHRCRSGCAACCIAPSISSAIPGMPQGKPAGVRCVQLTDDLLCKLIHSPDRPAVCFGFGFDPLICGNSRAEAMKIIADLEQ